MKGRVKESYTCPYCGYTWVPVVYPPNYCANSDCRRPISEKAKAKQKERQTRYALSKIEDVERFKELWMKNILRKEIAQELRVHPAIVSTAARALNLPRRLGGFVVFALRRMEENERRVLEYLNRNGGYIPYSEARKVLPYNAIKRLLIKRRIFKLRFLLKMSKRGSHQLIFKDEYYYKTFLCANRTAIIRLFFNALKKPEDIGVQKRLTRFLKRHLTEAERLAVLSKLGVRIRKKHCKKSLFVSGLSQNPCSIP